MQHVSLNAWGVHCVHEMFTKSGTDLSLSSILKQKIELRKIELFIKIQILQLSFQHLAWNYSHYFSKKYYSHYQLCQLIQNFEMNLQ